MPRRVLVINCHPDPDPGRLCAALTKAYVEGAAASGHNVRRLDLASIRVPFLGGKEEFEERPMPGSLVAAADSIKWCENLVLVTPLWLGTMPALLKAFLEQVMRPGFAFQYGPHGDAQALLPRGVPPESSSRWECRQSFIEFGSSATASRDRDGVF